MGRFVRGKDLKASTIKSPNTLGDIQGGAILADSITSIGDITVVAGNITADVITGNSYVGVSASPAGSPNEVQYNNAGSLGASANFTYDGTYYNGRFGVIRLYTGALTADEILQNYNATKWRFGL